MPTPFDVLRELGIFILDKSSIAVALLFLLLYVREYLQNRKARRNPEKIFEENQQKGYSILHRAIRKSQDIIGKSEIEQIKHTAEGKLQTDHLTKEYLEALHESQESFDAYLQSLRVQVDESVNQSQGLMKDRVNMLFEQFEQNLSSFLTETQTHSTEAITLEIQAARNLIETYKKQQLTAVDENIIAMLERTLSLVLTKKLSLKEHTDLVYESLEKAKAEKFII